MNERARIILSVAILLTLAAIEVNARALVPRRGQLCCRADRHALGDW